MKKWYVLGILLIQGILLFASITPMEFEKPLYISTKGIYNQTITSTQDFGFALTSGFSEKNWIFHESIRFHLPEFAAAFSAVRYTPTTEKNISFQYGGKIRYYQYQYSNGAASFSGFYGISLRTSPNYYWTSLDGRIGIQTLGSWSLSYDNILWGFSPQLRIGLTQALGNKAYCSLFISTDTLTQEESQLSFLYGGKATLHLAPSLILSIQPMVRLSDFASESLFVTMQEVSVSITWFDKTKSEAFTRTLVGELI
jgi:hypothetical protein